MARIHVDPRRHRSLCTRAGEISPKIRQMSIALKAGLRDQLEITGEHADLPLRKCGVSQPGKGTALRSMNDIDVAAQSRRRRA